MRQKGGDFADPRELLTYRTQSRIHGISDEVFNEIITKFYSFYIDKRHAFLEKMRLLKTHGQRQDGTMDMGVKIISRSSPDPKTLLHRIPLIYKLLTSLHATPYQVATSIRDYMQNTTGLKDKDIRIQYDHGTKKSPPSLHALRAYSEYPFLTSICVHNNTVIITLHTLHVA